MDDYQHVIIQCTMLQLTCHCQLTKFFEILLQRVHIILATELYIHHFDVVAYLDISTIYMRMPLTESEFRCPEVAVQVKL